VPVRRLITWPALSPGNEGELLVDREESAGHEGWGGCRACSVRPVGWADLRAALPALRWRGSRTLTGI